MGLVLGWFKTDTAQAGLRVMEIRDLGALSGRVLLYGGPYSNLSAARAMMDWADAQGIAAGNRICTGDVIAYGADAAQTWDLIAAQGGCVVAGNCEKQLAEGADDCGCGFEAGTTCDLLSRGWYAHASAQLGQRARDAMGDCADIAVFTHAGRRVAVIHGGLRDIARFVWPASPEAVFAEEIRAISDAVGSVDMVVAGHCGIAFQRRIGDVDWLNAGVIGMPPHDGRPDTRFATLDAEGRAMIHRLSYDTTLTVAAMQAAGLTQGYERALQSGLWPSEDVLPPEMRRAGQAPSLARG